MNLYALYCYHMGPKDSHEAIEGYVIAEDDSEVFEKVKEYCSWYGDDDEDGVPFSQWCIENQGDYEREISDLYYGATLYRWEDLGSINHIEQKVLQKVKIKIIG